MLRPRCKKCASAAGWASIGGNALLAVTKWFAGIFCGSQALLADALHSTVDVLGSVITLVMLKLSQRRPTSRYPFGLAKLEDIAAMAVYLILVGAGAMIVVDAIHSIIVGHLLAPTSPALLTAAISIAVNAVMYYFISCAGRQTKSPSLLALGYENKVDALSSIAAFVGILGAMLGFATLDPIAAIVVSAIIITQSLRELYETGCRLTDTALPRNIRQAIEQTTTGTPHVQGVLAIKTRRLGPVSHADIDVLVDPDISVEAAQAVADSVAQRIRIGVNDIDTVRVCAHPSKQTKNTRTARLVELLGMMGELRTQQQTK